MKHLKRYDEGIFDFFRSNSEDDKIALDFMKRLKRISGISPYKIEFDNKGTEDGESYFKRYKIIFDDVPIKITQGVCDKRYTAGWSEETQKSWIKTGAIRKNNHTFYSLYTIQQKEYILARVDIVEDLFELVEKIYNEDKKHRRIKKIKD
jgi:hypothetical protein